MKRILFLLLFLVPVSFLLLNAFSDQKYEYYSIATGTTAGTYYPVGVGLANLYTEELGENVRVTGQSSGGSVENVDLLREGEAEFATIQGVIGDFAYQGKDIYADNTYEDLRAVTTLWPNAEQFPLKNSQITTGNLADIEGTNFSLGSRGSGTEQTTRIIMNSLGMSKKDINQDYLGFGDTISAMRDGTLQGGAVSAGLPTTAITDMYASGVNATLLDVSDEQLQKIQSSSEVFYRYTIPAETYPNQREEIRTIAQGNFMGTDANVNKETVYQITKNTYENLERVHGIHSVTKNITLENSLEGLTVPLHSGAYKYYKEQGVKVPENLMPPKEKKG
ncbi:C4-dicarboxylate ABC transporter substrate-binding protein [Marinococcus halophilus]|uniref:C4-dicarboxylate ABC transporter substrate-binding protein n=1 Tax=Marinococcus halophilus TaxID=1371 RepID=A0A510Y9N5_MARHA|nr:TAXI family TRAP transporter solute-binding subunit [Marinococcus halophilus]OZT79575.1 C4-dicarboxylate ABC transporter substrate-binding protein [Marinococcus halophilus]GEK60069.1 C4-dicarboxylate ABC transporter substrate-binding protein [Marinococcus halophilus]